jgi:hypothetical protein
MYERRKEESSDAQSRVVVVPVIVEPVPVHHHLAVVLDEVRNVEVAIAVLHKYTQHLPYHHPSSTLGVVSYSVS